MVFAPSRICGLLAPQEQKPYATKLIFVHSPAEIGYKNALHKKKAKIITEKIYSEQKETVEIASKTKALLSRMEITILSTNL